MMHEIIGTIQQYHWGVSKNDSIIHRIAEVHGIQPDKNKPCAEYWLGTHPKAPSFYRESKRTLDVDLPFLLKVLCINEPLSIQVHPDKQMAANLHKTNPDLYPDSNYKPEMLIALSPCEALCGFRPIEEITYFLGKLPALARLCGIKKNFDLSSIKDNEAFIRNAFTSLLTAKESDVTNALDAIAPIVELSKIALLGCLLQNLKSHYPCDPGVLCIYFLKFHTLKVGQALFIGENVPHAYIKGECVEIMAQSDNVIRAGLTPKFKDIHLLSRVVKFSEVNVLECKQLGPEIFLYDPPIPDFAVRKFSVEQEQSLCLPPVRSHSIILILNGCCQISTPTIFKVLRFGTSYVISPNMELKLTVLVAPFLAFQAYTKIDSY